MRRGCFGLLLLFLLVGPAAAQTRTDVHPAKVRINSTAADALCVGSSGGASPTCTGGIQAGQLAIAGTPTYLLDLQQTDSAHANIRLRRTGGTTSDWFVYLPIGSTDLRFFSGSDRLTLSAAGLLTVSLLKYTTNTTGTGATGLGANSPAVTTGAPYTWFTVTTADGSTGYIPVWK